MNEKRIPLVEEEAKHKKKSQSKGQPRSKHKHIYETVLLTRTYHSKDFRTGNPTATQTTLPAKVCTICGRIDSTDLNGCYYVIAEPHHTPIRFNQDLSDKALSLPKWYTESFFDKFAIKLEEGVKNE